MINQKIGMISKILKSFSPPILFFLIVAIVPLLCSATDIGETDYFDIPEECGASFSSAKSGETVCKSWEKGGQLKLNNSIDVGACVCVNECLTVPKNHYYYDDPINKTKQIDENEITLPVVLGSSTVFTGIRVSLAINSSNPRN